MKTIKELINVGLGRNVLLICSGVTIKEKLHDINSFIKKTNPVIFGINNMTSFWKPNYHLWTNTQRLRTYGVESITLDSTLLLGCNIKSKYIKEVIGNREYILVDYVDYAFTNHVHEKIPMSYKNGKIYGNYRTAGCLAIMILHLMKFNEINIIGMDGFTKHSYKSLISGEKSHHCYGEGYTDTTNWEDNLVKDKIITKSLHNLRDYGINFKILTSTKYEEFYKEGVL